IVIVSWKLNLPEGSTWEFVLRPLRFEVYSDVSRKQIKNLEEYLTRFETNKTIKEEFLADGCIKTGCQFNDDFASDAQGLQILPAKNQDST
ncbi:MAG TPA: hypothetical protein VGP47_04785, partial [Parachlamydiaceae bacterium]|nr:hypothetical protein [Parachlamydiaceae bacterium]